MFCPARSAHAQAMTSPLPSPRCALFTSTSIAMTGPRSSETSSSEMVPPPPSSPQDRRETGRYAVGVILIKLKMPISLIDQ